MNHGHRLLLFLRSGALDKYLEINNAEHRQLLKLKKHYQTEARRNNVSRPFPPSPDRSDFRKILGKERTHQLVQIYWQSLVGHGDAMYINPFRRRVIGEKLHLTTPQYNAFAKEYHAFQTLKQTHYRQIGKHKKGTPEFTRLTNNLQKEQQRYSQRVKNILTPDQRSLLVTLKGNPAPDLKLAYLLEKIQSLPHISKVRK